MDENATDEATRLELEIGTEFQKQLRETTRQIGLEIDSSQATILQPVDANRAGRKAKGKTETHRAAPPPSK